MKQTIYWAVRAFAILFTLFISLFALDVEKFAWLDLFIHLLPTLVLIIILIVSWKQEKIGGILWILAAVGFLIMAWGNANPLAYLIIAGPPLVIGILFLWSSTMNMSFSQPYSDNDSMNMSNQNR